MPVKSTDIYDRGSSVAKAACTILEILLED